MLSRVIHVDTKLSCAKWNTFRS